MKITHVLLAAILTTALAALPTVAQPGTAFTNNQLARLASTQIRELSALKTAAAVSTFTPQSYQLKKLETEKSWALGVIFYNLVYPKQSGKTFTFQSGSGVFDDVNYKNGVKSKNS